MRTNLPVTNVEYELREGSSIVSKTDLKGVITYVNPDFIEASGYTEKELLGQPHNLVRHPDMPVEAFDDSMADIETQQAVDRAGKEPSQGWRLLLGHRECHADL